MPRFLHRLKISLLDWIRFSPVVRQLAYHAKLCSRPLLSAGDKAKSERIETLCAAARLAETEEQILKVEKHIHREVPKKEAIVSSLSDPEERHIRKVAILKPWSESTGEPGVLFISFEYEWAKLLHAENLEELARRYHLVISPTWTPPHSAVNCLFPHVYPGPIYCLISNRTDLDTFPRLSPEYRMIDLFASSWVDPDLFQPVAYEDKEIDLVMLANFGVYKRHHALFRAMRELPESWRIVLIGQPNGSRTDEVLLSEAEAFGVRDRLELRQRISDEEVCRLLAQAKLSLICSRREGSCVAVVESMFAGTPVALLKGAQIGSGYFINEETGAFVDESRLAVDLQQLHTRAQSMHPRKWALENRLSAEDSSQRLNEFLAAESRSRNLPWNRDIEPMHWRPNPTLMAEAPPSWEEEEKAALLELTGITFG
ncbi:MAG: glycosyltransferase [Verrucomicrobiales bacterium]|nr:glycosyltransferase [Verrucomicrobiales bacterium]